MLGKLLVIAFISNVLIAAQCPEDTKCLSCDDTKCTSCYGYYLSDGKCMEPTEKVDNCVGYTNATTCEGCDLGYYYKAADKKCMKIDIANCVFVDPSAPTVCLGCDNGVNAKDGKCDSGNDKCPTNCDTCILGFCAWCSSGYSLDVNLACIKEPWSNCLVVDGKDATKCGTCRPGYYDTNTECKKNARIMGISSIVALVIAWVSF